MSAPAPEGQTSPSDDPAGEHEPIRPLVVVIGTAHWSRRWLAEHQVSRQLARHCDVLFVDPPLSRLTVRRHPELRPLLRRPVEPVEVTSGVHTILPRVLPGKDRWGVSALVDRQVGRAIRSASEALGRRPFATITTVPGRDLLQRADGVRVYWAKDDHRAGADLYGQSPRRLQRSEERLVQVADHFVVCSRALDAAWRARGHTATIIPNGCDVEHFASTGQQARPEDLPTADPFAIYVGTITGRIDVSLILATADAGIDVVMVGGQRRTQRWDAVQLLAGHPRVHLLGRRDYAALPAYLGAAAVGLIPYTVDAYNTGSYPLKLFEYLAAGLPVVSTPLPAVRDVGAPYVRLADDPTGFAAAVVGVVSDADAELTMACRARAERESWLDRADRIRDLIGLADQANQPERPQAGQP